MAKPAAGAVTVSNNLPLQLTSFIGREREVAEVKRLLGTTRLLTLTGAGGSGKTRLALQTAEAASLGFRDGAHFVSLSPLGDPALVISAIAGALDVQDTGSRLLLEHVKAYLQPRELLLVLDNFEHLLEAAHLAPELLAVSPGLRMLVTSRAALRVTGEQEYLVLPLAMPDMAEAALAQVAQVEAVRLFQERARAARPDFALTELNLAAVVEICRRLDGLPLAIELAAARVKLLSPQAMVSRLGDRFRLLTGGARDRPERQQTLESAIGWSYDLLDRDEQQLFRRLSVFSGGWTLEAAESVCGADGGPGLDLLEGLASLVDKSLVLQAEGAEDQPRFAMLRTILAYARARLAESGEEPGLQRRHADYFLMLAEQAEPQLKGHAQVVWFGRLQADHDNLRAALGWTLSPAGNRIAAQRLAGALWYHWQVHGFLGEGLTWLTRTLAAGPEPGWDARARVKALYGAAGLNLNRGDVEAARRFSEEQIDLARSVGDEAGEVHAFATLAGQALMRGDITAAQIFGEQSLSLSLRTGDPWDIGEGWFMLGYCAMVKGDRTLARACYDKSVPVLREVGDRYILAVALNAQGVLAWFDQEYEHGEKLLRESLTMTRELGARHLNLADSLHLLAHPASRRHDYRRATRLLAAADALRLALGAAMDPHNRAIFESQLAAARSAMGETAFQIAWAEGQAMTVDTAIAYALEPVDAVEPVSASALDASPPTHLAGLTDREVEVLRLVAQGLTSAQIADSLTISVPTVNAHLRNIYSKLGVSSRSAATRFAVEQGLV